jgi:type I restriction enzyme M protein
MDADLRKGDTLINPQHKDENNDLMLFDRVIANPPFSQDAWWTPAETSQDVKLDKDGKEKKIHPTTAKWWWISSDVFNTEYLPVVMLILLSCNI